MKKILASLLLLASASAQAAVIEFVPPNDPTGSVFTTNANDGWSSGRGVVFQATTDVDIVSVGLFHDLTGITVSYKVAQVTTADGDVATGETVLASGSAAVTTNGLEWIDFALPTISLAAGNFYHIEFSFDGNGNQNFFYDNDDVRFSQDGFEVIDGTQGGNTGNTVMPAVRLETFEGAPPAPATPVPTLSGWGLALLVLFMGMLAFRTGAARTD